MRKIVSVVELDPEKCEPSCGSCMVDRTTLSNRFRESSFHSATYWWLDERRTILPLGYDFALGLIWT